MRNNSIHRMSAVADLGLLPGSEGEAGWSRGSGLHTGREGAASARAGRPSGRMLSMGDADQWRFSMAGGHGQGFEHYTEHVFCCQGRSVQWLQIPRSGVGKRKGPAERALTRTGGCVRTCPVQLAPVCRRSWKEGGTTDDEEDFRASPPAPLHSRLAAGPAVQTGYESENGEGSRRGGV